MTVHPTTTVGAAANSDPLLTVPEAAAYLNLSERAVREMIRAGRLAAVRPTPRRTRLRSSELERFAAAATAAGAQR